jgi:hypothetical protein
LLSSARFVVGALLTAALSAQTVPSPYSCLTLRSDGQSAITNISAFAPIMPLRPQPFTAADFADACSGAPAYEVTPAGSWCASLTADPAARWIATSPSRTPVSALYCQSFRLPACGVQAASLRFSFCVDDRLGDPASDPNPVGVYLNGQPVAGFSGFGSQVTWTSTAIASLLYPGTNHLQVYVRDLGASVAGVMYSATICYVACRSDEVIRLRTGNGAIGGPDAAIRVLAGSAQTALPMTAANFAAASSGPPAAVVPPAQFWCTSLTADPQAKWISTDAGYGPRSALYSQAFTVGACSILSATLSFSCNVVNLVGDPGGVPNVGIFVNQNPVPLSALDGGSGCNLNLTASIPPVWLNGNSGANTLHVYVRDTGRFQNGVMYSATLTVVPCPPGSEVIALRSGQATHGFPDPSIRYLAGAAAAPLSNSPFTSADFSAASAGPAAYVVWNSFWAPTLPQDTQARWVSSTLVAGQSQPGAPRSAMFAHPFQVSTCRGDRKRAQLVIHYHADDGLGDPAGGGPNPLGLYLNGIPIPGTAGDISTWPGTNVKTITVSNVAPYLLTGANCLYVYVRDRNSGVSGVMYSARITISPCDWLYFGDPCGETAPNVVLSAPPTIGAGVEYQLRGDSIAQPRPTPAVVLLGFSDTVGPGGLPLPLDLDLIGGTGCRLLVSMDVQLGLVTDAGGNATVPMAVPDDVNLEGLSLFLQTLLLDGRSNPLGLSATRGIAVDIRRP